MDQALAQLYEISRFYGADPDYVLAGGGNTSLKIGGVLHVKASGTSLAEASGATFVEMDREKLAVLWRRRYPDREETREAEVLADLNAARVPGASLRPSVETLLHDLFPEPLVVHTHPALVNGLTCGRDGERAARELLGDDVLWVEAIEPGYVLAARMRELMEAWRAKHGRTPSLVLIENHGLFVAAPDAGTVRRLTERVVKAMRGRVGREPDESEAAFDRERAGRLAPALRMLLKGGESSIVVFRTSAEVRLRIADEAAFRVFDEPFTPDHMVYCGRKPLWVAGARRPRGANRGMRARGGGLPGALGRRPARGGGAGAGPVLLGTREEGRGHDVGAVPGRAADRLLRRELRRQQADAGTARAVHRRLGGRTLPQEGGRRARRGRRPASCRAHRGGHGRRAGLWRAGSR